MQSRSIFPAQMRTTEASIDGMPAEIFLRESVRDGFAQASGNELLIVVPPQPLEPGTEHEIEIHHEGNVVLDAGHQVYFVTSRGTWYPGRGTQFARYDVTWRYPKTLNLISAGQVTEDRTEGDLHITRRVPDGRLDMLAFNLGQYDEKTVEHNGLQIEVNANHEVEDALRVRQPDPLPLSTGNQCCRGAVCAAVPELGGERPELPAVAAGCRSGCPVVAGGESDRGGGRFFPHALWRASAHPHRSLAFARALRAGLRGHDLPAHTLLPADECAARCL